MKVMTLNTSDSAGGAAKAAYRLHRALRARGVDSRMLVQHKASRDDTVIGPVGSLRAAWSQLRPTLDSVAVRAYRRRSRTPFNVSLLPSPALMEHIRAQRPDIVHLHWICGGFLPIEALARIRAPIVWTLHDMWAFTGGCHYDQRCGRFRAGCGRCPVLGSNTPDDLSAWVFRRKQKAFGALRRLTAVGLSRWMAECARSSRLLGPVPTVHLPNAIDTDRYRPMDRLESRRRLGLPPDGRLILFTAARPTWDPRKGWHHLLQALKELPPVGHRLVLAGGRNPPSIQAPPIPIHHAGEIRAEADLAALYSACDLTVVPSVQENLSNVLMESLACGTPVVAFDIGGNRDLVDHTVNGYLARPFEPQDLAHGMMWILENDSRATELSRQARSTVESRFGADRVAEQYIRLYEQALSA
jgi:glycosyltransferase involved in cell wall biosynthesis